MTDYKDYGYHNNHSGHIFNYIQKPLISLISKTKNKFILDLGCGNGYLANYLISQGYNIYGTDASEEGVAIARQTNPGRFFIQDISTGELPDELQEIKFDTIISTEVIEHLYDPEGFIRFCKKALRGDGEVILPTPYHGYLKNLILSFFNKWDGHLGPMWHGGHIKFWSRITLTKALVNEGFTIIAFKGCGRTPYLWKSMIIKARLV